MWKVCVADDEKYVLKSIIQRIEISGMPFEIAGVAGDGREALELYETYKPDVFFVDINMPIIDGLDFISRIRLQDPESSTLFVIISGYDDFVSMKRAIQLGVVNYLKKPISMEEFTLVLETLGEQLKNAEEKEPSADIINWVDFTKNLREQEVKGNWICIYGTFMNREAGSFLNNWKRLAGGVWKGITFYGVEEVLLLFSSQDVISERKLEEWLAFGQLRPAKRLACFYGAVADYNQMISDFEDVFNLRFYGEASGVVDIRKSPDGETEDEFSLYEKFDCAVENGKKEKIKESLNEIWKCVLQDKKQYQSVRRIYQSLIIVMANKYTKYSIGLPDGMRQEFFPFATARFWDSYRMREQLQKYADQLNGKISETLSKSELAERAIQYMKQHYQADISLGDIAGALYTAPAYLAKRFKEKKNVTVMQYLETIRMNRARGLLENSGLSVTEIAQEVGYSDPNYFTRTFKKNCAKTPKQYRDECEKKEKRR